MPFQLSRQMRRYGVLVEVGKNHILRFLDIGELIYKACIGSGHGGRAADGCLVVACVIAGLSHGFHNQRRHVGLADVRIGAGNK